MDKKEAKRLYYLANKELYIQRAYKWKKENLTSFKKTTDLTNWKKRGIISNDWEKTYDYYINCFYCEWCDKEFDCNANRCLDHDHDINDDVNIRGVLCRGCNSKDYLGKFYKQEQLW